MADELGLIIDVKKASQMVAVGADKAIKTAVTGFKDLGVDVAVIKETIIKAVSSVTGVNLGA